MAEAFNALFEAELIRDNDPRKGIDDVGIAVAEYIDWSLIDPLHGEPGMIPPA